MARLRPPCQPFGGRQGRGSVAGQCTRGTAYLQRPAENELLVIARVWHGWTTPENADAYERLLKDEIFPGIAEKGVEGYEGIRLLRRPGDDEVEFVTIMWFDSWDAVREFAGEDYGAAYVPPAAREVLARFDERSQHYEVRERIDY